MNRLLIGVVLAGAGVAAAGCGSSDDGGAGAGGSGVSSRATGSGGSTGSNHSAGSGGAGGSTSTGTGAGLPGAQPPPAGAPTPGDGPGAVFAIKKLYLGDTNPDGTVDKTNAWKNFGYNIDGIVTQCQGNECQQVTGQCHPNAGASATNIYPDGFEGRDNSFGYNIYDNIFLGLSASTTTDLNDDIQHGHWSLLIAIDDLGNGGSYNPLSARIYEGADRGAPPDFDGTDSWPVTFESLNNPSDLGSAKIQLPGSYVSGNTWVSGQPGVVTFSLPLAGFPVPLQIQHAVVSFEMSADHQAATGGIISGVIDTEAFAESFRDVAGSFDPSLCAGTTVESILNQLRQASDIMLDGSPGAGQTCDAISVGFGFDAVRVQLGQVAPPVDPGPDPCP